MGEFILLLILLRNTSYFVNGGQKVAVRTPHGTAEWFETGQGVRQSCILSPHLLNDCSEIMQKALHRLDGKVKVAFLKLQTTFSEIKTF